MAVSEVTRVLRAHVLAVVLLVAGLVVRVLSSAGLGLTAVVGLISAAAAYVVLVRWGCWRWLAALAMVPALFDGRVLVDQQGREVAGLVAASVALLVLTWRPPEGLPRFELALALLVLVPLAANLALVGLPQIVWWPAAAALGVTAMLRGGRGKATQRPQADEVDAAALAAYDARYGATALPPVAIVIAAYNEAEGLPGVLTQLPTEVCGLAAEVIVVDDGSSDGTAAALAAAPARVVACEQNRGQGAALRLGYRIAREHGARYVLTTDADGQYDVADFPVVLQPILDDRADFVSGSRILGAQHTHDKVRRVGVHVFAWLATLLTGRRLTDTSFGLRAMRAELTGVVTLNQPQYQSSELLLGVLSHGYRVLEVPGTMHVRSAGSTKKGKNLVYGSRYARVMTGTWWREGCPRPAAETAPALRHTRGHGAD